ncbi:hypothetical protein C1H46_007550 [Malus baccata]|uniref:Uncharacterized protein n=1 Tax=Malus baccata TaxID=106549 RepID=A0A540N8E9_MALBA|nr:hypothetical protein C1H46_007550 [Malus baccata]
MTTRGVENRCYIDSQPDSNVTGDSFGTSEVERASKSRVLQRYGEKILSGPETGCVVDVSKDICQSGDSVSLDNVIRAESSNPMLSVQGNANSETSLDIDGGIKVSYEEVMVHDIGNVDAISEQPCRHQLPTSLQIGSVEELMKAISSAEVSMIVGLSSLGETLAVCFDYGRGTTWNSDKVSTNYDENIIVSNDGNVNFIGRQASPDGAFRPFVIYGTKRSSKVASLVGDRKSVKFRIKNERKFRTPLDYSRASNTSVEPRNISARENSVYTTVSSSLKDASAEVAVSGVESLDIGSEPDNDGVNVSRRNNSLVGIYRAKLSARSDVNSDPDETSSKYIKRKKVSTSYLVRTTSQTIDGPADKCTPYTDAPWTNDDTTQEEELLLLTYIFSLLLLI